MTYHQFETNINKAATILALEGYQLRIDHQYAVDSLDLDDWFKLTDAIKLRTALLEAANI